MLLISLSFFRNEAPLITAIVKGASGKLEKMCVLCGVTFEAYYGAAGYMHCLRLSPFV